MSRGLKACSSNPAVGTEIGNMQSGYASSHPGASLSAGGARNPGTGTKAKQVNFASGWENLSMVVQASRLNTLFLVFPFAWASHWRVDAWGHEVAFVLCFVTIIPFQRMFDWCGDQVVDYPEWDKEIGDFLAISLKNCVEATLAAILLKNCHLRLLQSTIVGVILLHLLLVPGISFCIIGVMSRDAGELELSKFHLTINNSLLMIGVLSIMLPTVFFSALSPINNVTSLAAISNPNAQDSNPVNDAVRDALLKMSRGMSVMLLPIYLVSQIYRHLEKLCEKLTCCAKRRARGQLRSESDIQSIKTEKEKKRLLNPFACLLLLFSCIVLMAITAEFLVESIDPIRERWHIEAEWFGLILLPLVSFSPEAAIAAWKFVDEQQLNTSTRCHDVESVSRTTANPAPAPAPAPASEPKVPDNPAVHCAQRSPHSSTSPDASSKSPSAQPTDGQSFGAAMQHLEPSSHVPEDAPRPPAARSPQPAHSPAVKGSGPGPRPQLASGPSSMQGAASSIEPPIDERAPEQPSPDSAQPTHGRPIDLAIQFTLWWMPLLVLFGWWTGRPLHLLFDIFEVAVLLGSCFLVNYVTADSKANFAEGAIMITFYAMIAITTWFYTGQPQIELMLNCPGSVANAVGHGVEDPLTVA